MKVLHLTVTKQWFDMILSDVKKEEYRWIKTYWMRRLFDMSNVPYGTPLGEIKLIPIEFDYVHFTNGYGKLRPQVVCKWNGVKIGKGKSEWGAPNDECIIISLGDVELVPTSTP